MMTPSQRKAAQRLRDKSQGWVEILVRVPASKVDIVKAFVASLPPPAPQKLEGQLSLLDQIEEAAEPPRK